MSISELFHIGMAYLKEGLVIGVLFILLFFAGYYVMYRKLCKGKKKLPFARLLWWGVWIAYLVVVIGVTLLLRGGYYGYENTVIQPLFYSYRDAWVHWSAAAWRNIIFNFCMFVPLGFWLPLGLKSFRRFWKTYLAGFGFTLLIETMQLMTRRGIFELDDVLGNTVGTMIGYGIFMLGEILQLAVCKRKERRRGNAAGGRNAERAEDGVRHVSGKGVLAAQIPLALTILGFAVIFENYERQELGNNPNGYVEALDKSLITMSGRDDFDRTEPSLPVYQVPTLSVQEAKEKGEEIFGNLAARIDESRTIVYDNTLVLYSAPSRYSLWISYQGGGYELTDFQVLYPEAGAVGETVTGAEEETIRKALFKMGANVPETAEFAEVQPGKYRFTADMIEEQGIKINGTLTCDYYGESGLGSVRIGMVSCVPYKDFPAISEQEAYEKIADGEFSYLPGNEIAVEVKACEVKYNIDSKGFYQPNYCFTCAVNGEDGEIWIPALK
ncbi:MAG: VanZ family protein [Lachnospiraceae bacterium]|nr:VanZ family protein [Lachnospiraceae bacterium]